MKKNFVMLALGGFLSTGCATIGSWSGPYVADGFILGTTKGPIIATSYGGSSKMGRTCAQNILGIASWGDNSIESARRDGGIVHIASVDFERFSVLHLFSQICTIVRGD